MLRIGRGKGDITAFYKNAAMLGYAMYHHIMKEIETPLYARAFVFENGRNKVAFVNCELGFITPAVKRGVLDTLDRQYAEFGYDDANLLLSAQHTHCAPGGYSHYSLYNMAVPGFIEAVYDKIVAGIVEAIVAAERNKKPGTVHFATGEFAPETTISFNRSIRAYNNNEDVEPLPFEKRHLAVDRSMTVLKITGEDGSEMGSINWFAVHTTSLSNNFYRVCSDNKGFASTYLEDDRKFRDPDYLGVFAQGNCGDVSPKWVFNPKHPFQRGKYEGKYRDDLKSAKYSGQLQFGKAREILDNMPGGTDGAGDRLDAVIRYVDFSAIDIDPKFTNGVEGCLTSPACMGVAMLEGSKYDGPGMHPVVGIAARSMARSYRLLEKALIRDAQKRAAVERKWKAQGVKDIALESVTHKVLGARHARNFIVPGFLDETIRNLKIFDIKGAYETRPWTPQVLPLHIVRLGDVAVCGFPFEITTVAGYRLKKTLEDALLGRDGIARVILCPYANAYSGYITTFEEYQVQMYEGGHNVFGQWALNALQQEFTELAAQLLDPARRDRQEALIPPDPTPEELQKLSHFESITARKEEKRVHKKERRDSRHTHRMNKRVMK